MQGSAEKQVMASETTTFNKALHILRGALMTDFG